MNDNPNTNPYVLHMKTINTYGIPVVFLRHAEGENNTNEALNALFPNLFPLTNKGAEIAKNVNYQ